MTISRRFLLAASAAALTGGAAFAQVTRPGVAPPPAPLPSLTGPAREQALAQASAALNASALVQGRFLQIAADGASVRGSFYISRPGRLRFEYDAPAPLLIISDGRVVHLRDRDMRTTERTPLDSTPLILVLRAQIDLARDARIVGVTRDGGALLVTARDRTGTAEGQITMRFEGAPLALRSWEILDAAGARTRVLLSNISYPASLDRRLFRPDDIIENRPGRPH